MNATELAQATKDHQAIIDGIHGRWFELGEADFLISQWFDDWASKLMDHVGFHLSDDRTIRLLYALKDRYFRSAIAHPYGHLCHYSDCEVYRALFPEGPFTAPCTCGFNYELRWLGGDFAYKLNPRYQEEYHKQEVGIFEEPITEKEQAENFKLIMTALGTNFKKIPQEEYEAAEQKELEAIKEVFGDEYYQFLKKEYDKNHPSDK